MAATLNCQHKSLRWWFHVLKRWNSFLDWSLTQVVVMVTRWDMFFIFKTRKMDLPVLFNLMSQDKKTGVGLSNVPQSSWPALLHPLRKRRRDDSFRSLRTFWVLGENSRGFVKSFLLLQAGELWDVWSVGRCAPSVLGASKLWLEDFLLVSGSRKTSLNLQENNAK